MSCLLNGSYPAFAALEQLGAAQVDGCDPYTHQAYKQRLGRPAMRHSFEDIENGCLDCEHYTLIVCSFALHLADTSRLVCLGTQLALAAAHMLVISPHKKPHITEAMGWRGMGEIVVERVHVRCYQSLLHDVAA